MQVVLALLLQDAAALLAESSEALRMNEAVAMTVECGDLKMRATLKLPSFARVEQTRGKASTLVVVDDKHVWTYDPKANEYLKFTKPRVLAALGPNTGLDLIAQAYFDPKFAESVLKGARDVKLSEDGLTASWTSGGAACAFTIEARTRLPARVAVGKQVFVVSGFEADPKVDEKTFAFAIPEGAKRKKLAGAGLLAAGAEAPAFELQTLDGKAAKLADYRGKVVLLNFWFHD